VRKALLKPGFFLILVGAIIGSILQVGFAAGSQPSQQEKLIIEAGSTNTIFGIEIPVPTPDFPSDAQSTTGPVPPPGLDQGIQPTSLSASTTLSVPAYIWYRGCGPTATGMVLGYWDGNGFPNLVAGNAITQTTAVDDMISSTGNYNDYCIPLDYYPDPLLDDLSTTAPGDAHADDSIADFMLTSQSARGNYYGWSYFSDVADSLEHFVEFAAPEYTGQAENLPFGSFPWEDYKAEIDADRPVVFLVDTDGNGGTDHFVAGIGYDDNDGTPQYGCLNTWDKSIHWYEYAAIGSGQLWGIYGATTFEIDIDPPPSGRVVINEIDPSNPDILELFNAGGQAVDMNGWQLVIEDSPVYTFTSFTLQPGAYIAIEEYGNPASNTTSWLYTGKNLSFWPAYGHLGLIDGSETDSGIDFVRWGTSGYLPPSGTSWTGTNPPGVSANRTLGRDTENNDTDDGDDWCLEISTLGAQNSVCNPVFLPLVMR